jgi:hypothetical protein
MIQANELRIGNYVSMFGEQNLIVDISLLMDIENGVEFIPIPLTPEILEKCGFKETDVENMYEIDSDKFHTIRVLVGSISFPFLFSKDKEYFKLYGIKYLHQLQNLYFALTGEELSITL